jgi:hypothetical protein
MDITPTPIASAIRETKYLESSPFIQGFLAGVKGALLGAPMGGFVQALRGKDPIIGAIVGGLGAGLVSGGVKALSQSVNNSEFEENLRYHVGNMKDREPFTFLPPPQHMQGLFSRFHNLAHRYVHRKDHT